MARPQKSGLDYFPLQTNIFSSGSELMPVIRRYGGTGLCTYLYILCSIYQNGYYYKTLFFDDYIAEMADILKADEPTILASIELLEKIGVLTVFREDDSVVLTSRGVQKRYVEVAKDRKRDAAELLENVHGKYWILTDEETLKRIGKSKTAKTEILTELKNEKLSKKSFSENNGGFSENNGGFSENNGGFSENFVEKQGFIPEKPYLLSSPFISLGNISMKEVNDKYETMDRDSKLGYAEEIELSDNPSVESKDLDEFDEETEREKRERKLGEKLGLSPKLERMKPGEKGDPTTAPKLEFDLEGYNRFSQRWGLKLTNTANLNGIVYEIKWDDVSKKLEQSKWLREKITMDFIFRHYREILDGRYDDYEKEKPKTGHELFMELISEMGDDESGGEKSGDEK